MNQPRSPWSLPILVSLLLLLPSLLSANPLPDGMIFIHVQPANFDEAPDISACDQIVQHTSEDGILEFDLYLRTFDYPPSSLQVREFQIELEWPEAWTWLDYELPYLFAGGVSVSGNSAVADVTLFFCEETDNEVLLLMRCFIAVEGFGRFLSEYPNAEVTDCQEETMTPFVAPATAGVVCDYIVHQCSGSVFLCRPSTDTPLLNLQVPMGETVVREIEYWYESALLCDFTCEGSEDWMETSAEEADYGLLLVTLTVDTAGLAPGLYGGWVRVEGEGAACTWIDLEVLPVTGVELSSWSEVKARY